ncbi:MAG: phenylacetate--CoA ligase family protein [Kiloniellaceae bacterium]
MASSLESEIAEQRRWRLRPAFQKLTVFDSLVRNEFLSSQQHGAMESALLQPVIAFAVARVPFYRELFARLGLRAADIASAADLVKLPLLSKIDLVRQGRRLQAEQLPQGEKIFGPFLSSGTTGRPAKVLHTHRSNSMFTFLGQRQIRWLRWDPMARTAEIRLPSQLPGLAEGRQVDVGETCRRDGWRYMGSFFETGPYCGFSVFNPVEAQVEWLRHEQPTYLTGYSETLEQLALAARGGKCPTSLRGLRAISEQLTEGMRRRIAGVFGAPVAQNYGLNEIGLVAGMCEAGRYHVHSEHCIVEIVDQDGKPCAPGQSGRIVVTALKNLAMPLLRYDTDDVAEVPEGPCPCGRILPSFGKVVGRYSRIAYLPEGTLGYVGALRTVLEEMPEELLHDLRQFQVHQFRDGRFELRLRTTATLPPEVGTRVDAAWRAATGGRDLPLKIVEVDEIARPPGGKYQDFTSDFMPAMGSAEEPEPEN